MDSAISPGEGEDGTVDLFSNSSCEMTPNDARLTDLATAKQDGKLPVLGKFTLSECVWSRWISYDRSCISADWNIPEIISNGFCRTGIDFTATVRAVNTASFRGCVSWSPSDEEEEVSEFYITPQGEQ
jgi:hypothetical protein